MRKRVHCVIIKKKKKKKKWWYKRQGLKKVLDFVRITLCSPNETFEE